MIKPVFVRRYTHLRLVVKKAALRLPPTWDPKVAPGKLLEAVREGFRALRGVRLNGGKGRLLSLDNEGRNQFCPGAELLCLEIARQKLYVIRITCAKPSSGVKA